MDEVAIRRLSAKTGFGLKLLSKDFFISRMLKDLEGLLGDECVLKGGTAIARAGHLDASRLSEDIDLDVYTSLDMKGLAEMFATLLSDLGPFDVGRPRIHRAFVRFDASYINHFDENDRIKVELAPRSPGASSYHQSAATLLQSPFTVGEAAVHRVYSREALFAMKVGALVGRQKGKDIFDIRGIYRKGIEIEDAARSLLAMADAESSNVEEMIEGAMASLDWMMDNVRTVANATNHYVPRNEIPDWREVIREVGTILTRLSKDLP